MATIMEREKLFTERANRGIILSAVNNTSDYEGDTSGWQNIVKATRQQSLFDDPEQVFKTHSAILGTPNFLLAYPYMTRTESGQQLNPTLTTLNLILEVLKADKTFFSEFPKDIVDCKGPFSGHFNFIFDATSSEAVVRSMTRMGGYSTDLSGYQNSVDRLSTKLLLPSPNIGVMYQELIDSYEYNFCQRGGGKKVT